MALKPKTRIKLTCSAWSGDTGRVEKYVPFDYYYVRLRNGGRQFVHARCVTPTTARGRTSPEGRAKANAQYAGARRRRKRR